MNHTVEEWMFVAMHRDVAPEFRTLHDLLDEAYSGPEQRRLRQDRLSDDPGRRITRAHKPAGYGSSSVNERILQAVTRDAESARALFRSAS